MDKVPMSYTEAVSELDSILKYLEESSEVDMDKISLQVKRASDLMDFCKKQLYVLDKELEKMISELE